ncbi:acyl-CoA dehydrogenase family protein [Sinisalibacter aestuarii]|uniref:Acyl-CoA dehydrogenase n=1 Tax=Sinisalibacter aestuarii TaxID=2949426 RepID=A0ABQ5LSV3_9RHOB|nr:acyl-CoA dehydrogenase family protein [Sinisalibacter aestuarii]GKY88047.1 acyl-CoA dehydrogenase [Sinisalibacter aestuarii]
MKPFAAPVDDILFSLTHVAGAPRLAEYDGELVAELAGHFAAFAEGVIAPIDEPGDREGARLEQGRVRLPAGYKAAFDAFVDQGWPGLTAPEAFGGQGLGGVVGAVVSEIETGASQAFNMLVNLTPGAIRTLMAYASDDQKARFIPPMAEGRWLGTMCLTEPGAGSDLGRVRTRAARDGAGWKISGEKIFISGGDQDLSERILHLVLARTGAAEEGVKGLSLFACTSELADGSRNPIRVTRIEEKMGLHAQPTCQLAFDGAEGELIGAEGEGLKAMFTLMNHARIDVALQGVAHAARAHDIASAYAAERVQGRGSDGPVSIDRHGDVRRMLDEIDAAALGGRAMTHLALVTLETGDDPWLVEFLTPVIKAHCSEAGIRAAETAMQVLGGYGYLEEYRLSQIYRDARIIAIYEGTNGIHAMALAGRLIRLENGAAFDAFARFVEGCAQSPGLARAYAAWQAARAHLEAGADPGPVAMPFLRLTARVLEQAVWTRIAAAADHHPDPARIARVAALVARQAARAEADLAEITGI